VVVVRCGKFGFAREIDHKNQLPIVNWPVAGRQAVSE
jgi:hypothetical protein